MADSHGPEELYYEIDIELTHVALRRSCHSCCSQNVCCLSGLATSLSTVFGAVDLGRALR